MSSNFPKTQFIPVLTTPAGNCLTYANWQQSNINCVCYYLDELLMKPGIRLLTSLTHLKMYLQWPGTLVLNASRIVFDKRGIFTIYSRYDGNKTRFHRSQLWALLKQLRPDIAIVPSSFKQHDWAMWQDLAETMQLFVHAKQAPLAQPLGVYCVYEQQQLFTDFLVSLQYASQPVYAAGDFSLTQIRQLQGQGVHFIESDSPAKQAVMGMLYAQQTDIDLLAANMAQQMVPIDEQCTCRVCQQQLTRAYLHHLLQQTPTLAQRFLIQHNVHYCQNLI